MKIFETERIVTPEISFGGNMSIAPAGLYNNTQVYSIVPSQSFLEGKYYLLGLLNSTLFWWFLTNTGTTLRGGYFRFKTNYLAPFSIRSIDFTNSVDKAQHGKMVSLVTQMLELHKSKASAKTQSQQDVYERQIRAVDKQIDELVYELYGLTKEEQEIVRKS